MSYCSSCGAAADGKFCAHCGQPIATNPTAGTATQSTATQKATASNPTFAANNPLGIDLSALGNAVTGALAAQKDYEQTGQISGDMLAGLNSAFGMHQITKDAQQHLDDLERQNKQHQDRLKKARADIGKRICPDCGAKFKKRQTSCAKCGASTMVESYEEY